MKNAIGGWELLQKHEQWQQTTAILAVSSSSKTMQEPAADAMFSLFPTVDQLSGTPLFEEHYNIVVPEKTQENETKMMEIKTLEESNILEEESSISPLLIDEAVGIEKVDSIISLAKQRIMDRER